MSLLPTVPTVRDRLAALGYRVEVVGRGMLRVYGADDLEIGTMDEGFWAAWVVQREAKQNRG